MNKRLYSSFVACFVLLSTTTISADNALVYPPENSVSNNQFSSNNTMAQGTNHIPMPINRPASDFAVPNIQRPMMLPSANMQNNHYPRAPQLNNYQGVPFANNMPFGNNMGNGFNPFSGTNMPFGNNTSNSFNPFSGNNMPFNNNSGNAFGMPKNPMNSMFGNNNNSMPFFGNANNSNRKKAWGDKRNIWPDFYTDFTDEAWDTMSSGPRDLGRMPGGWRFPHISSPDPVTVSDAIVNQFPPIAEEAGNMMDFTDWGVFD